MNTFNNNYYVSLMNNQIDNTKYYVRLENNKFKRKINFKQYNNILEVKYEFVLDGKYKIPSDLLIMNVTCEIAQISNISVIEMNTVGTYHKYYAQFLITTKTNNTTDYFDKDINFIANLGINKDVFNRENLSAEFNSFANDIKKINFNDQITYNNYFPISKLNEFYISSKYKQNYDSLTNLPNDFFNWSTTNMSSYPIYYFIKNNNFNNQNYVTIDNLYSMNIKNPKFTKTFDDVKLTLNYKINNVQKQLDIKPDQINTNVINTNLLSLNIKTLYNFETNEIIQSDEGVNGIYFPIPTEGKISIVLEKDKIKYTDEIDFSFKNDFYSESNQNISISLTNFIATNGEWQEIVYA